MASVDLDLPQHEGDIERHIVIAIEHVLLHALLPMFLKPHLDPTLYGGGLKLTRIVQHGAGMTSRVVTFAV
jgi:hypothetical protein